MRKLLNYIVIFSFLGFIGVIGVVNALSSDKETAFYENRELEQRPDLNIESLKDGSYFKRFDSYFSDQFYEKEKILQKYTKLTTNIKTKTNALLPEENKGAVVNGYYVSNDGWILQVPNPTENTTSEMQKYADNINNLAKKVQDKGSEVYYFNSPYKSSMLYHLYPDYLSKDEDLKEREAFLKMLDSSKLNIIDLQAYFDKNFSKEQLEQMYFKTDHHWNIGGANTAFDYMLKEFNDKTEKGTALKAVPRQAEKCISDENFLGSWNRVIYGIVDTDEKVCYEPLTEDFKSNLKVELKVGKDHVKYDVDKLYASISSTNPEYVTYAALTTNDYAEFTIYNPNSVTDKSVVVIKDSFFNALVMKTAEQFRKVTVIDPRFTVDRSINDFLENNTYDYVWFFYSNNAYFTPSMFDFSLKQ